METHSYHMNPPSTPTALHIFLCTHTFRHIYTHDYAQAHIELDAQTHSDSHLIVVVYVDGVPVTVAYTSRYVRAHLGGGFTWRGHIGVSYAK